MGRKLTKTEKVLIPVMLPAIAIIILITAVIDDYPDGDYFDFVLVSIFEICAFLSFYTYRNSKKEWSFILAIIALIYNPFFQIDLGDHAWPLVNIATIVLLVITIFAVREKPEPA